MTTDAERREATDAWTIALREQRVREMAETLDRRNATIAQQAQRVAELEQQLAATESALALATNSTPGHGTGVWVPLATPIIDATMEGDRK